MRNYRCATPEELVKEISAVILEELPPEETVSLIRELLRQ